MLIIAHIVMLAWIPAVVLLNASPAKRHRAVIHVMLAAWLFLPNIAYDPPGLPQFNKTTATMVGVLLGIVLFDLNRLLSFRPRWFDIPIVVYCALGPITTSLVNGLGLWEGLSWTLSESMIWGLPYLFGRLYFNNSEAMRDLLIGLVIGGLVYIPICVFEARMYPQLHDWIYGFRARISKSYYPMFAPFTYRPLGFMETTFMVSMLMASATIASFWLWQAGVLRRLWSIPIEYITAALFATTVLCKVFSGIIIMVIGLGALAAIRWAPSRAFLVVLVLAPVLYIGVRTAGLWHGEPLLTMVGMVSEARRASAQFRFQNEDMLIGRALERPILGWGRFGRNRVYDERGRDLTVTDGLWIIDFGHKGAVGLAALLGFLLTPVALFVRRCPPLWMRHPAVAPATAMAVLVCGHMIDNLPNAMPNPVFPMMAGGLACYLPRLPRYRRVRRATAASPVPSHRRPGTVRPGRSAGASPVRGPRS